MKKPDRGTIFILIAVVIILIEWLFSIPKSIYWLAIFILLGSYASLIARDYIRKKRR